MKKQLVKIASAFIAARVKNQAGRALVHQQNIFHTLLANAVHTSFGKDHRFAGIHDHDMFRQHVPLKRYTDLLPYIERIRQGEKDVLWPGRPLYMAKTSGTTGDYKYIPISKQAMPHHIKAARNTLACYVARTGKAGFVQGKMLLLQGSPELEKVNGIPTGRLSGIVAHYVPAYLKANRLPTYTVNVIPDWNHKVQAIVQETLKADMRLFGGIPSWLQHYFEALLKASGKQNLGEVFPHLQVLTHGGVNFEPYRKKFEALFGKEIDIIETYPATEGFIAYQDDEAGKGLLLNTNAGMFFEFIDMKDFHCKNPQRISLEEIKLHTNYALVLNTNSGLFGYVIGDTVSFVSKNPYRIVVTGRTKEYVSAFGEQVYAHQTDAALTHTIQKYGGTVNEYHVYPVLNGNASYHHWLMEFEKMPEDLTGFEQELDRQMHKQNIFYRDIVLTGVIGALKISVVPKGSFYTVMQQVGKLGEQHKVPRLANDEGFSSLFSRAT